MSAADLTDCDPIIKNKDISQTLKSVDGITTLDPEGPAIPCGLVAKSIFTDRYSVLQTLPASKPIIIDETNIAWESDIKYKFKN